MVPLNCLVVTADDFGLSREVNEAVEIAHLTGILSAASLMVAGTAAADALERAKRMSRLRVGLHVAVTDARPALPPEQIPRLVDENGRLRPDLARLGAELALSGATRRQMRAEVEAQFQAFQSTGLKLDHVSVHQHYHLHPVVGAMVIDVGRQYGVRAIRVPRELRGFIPEGGSSRRVEDALSRRLAERVKRVGLMTPDAVFGLRWSGRLTKARLRYLVEKLPHGFWEIYAHPATSDAFLGHAPGYRYADELSALTDPANAEALRLSGRRLCGYQDVVGSASTTPV
ncbi:MAG TPA: hopanoid biosynthesis-associated protein HpnK [Roseiarcus sp.]|nr:hopanoid biosynthesis-associated protein HpnK [Roseiarcus sp.]